MLADLGAPVIALGAVVAALVVTAVVLAFTLFGGGSGSPVASGGSPSSSPSPIETTTQRVGEGGGSAKAFASPSRNITCEISKDDARCGIADLATTPVQVAGCDGTVGYVVVVDSSGKVAAPCVPSDQQPQVAGKKVEVVAYGKKVSVGRMTCRSKMSGMRCTANTPGKNKGFTIARAGIATF
jgi:hypothetical protein